jgi:hypothetical protein
MPELDEAASLEANLAAAVLQVEKTPNPCAVQLARRRRRQVLSTGSTNSLWLRRKTDPGELVRQCGTGLQCRRRSGAVLLALVTGPAMRDPPAVQKERQRCAARHCESGPLMRDYPAVQVKGGAVLLAVV